MNEEANGTTVAAFEAAMQRCAERAGLEPRFERNVDGNYAQPEMRAALVGWLGSRELVQGDLRKLTEFAVARFAPNPSFQCGFVEYVAHAAGRLDFDVPGRDEQAGARAPEVTREVTAAAFDNAAIDALAHLMKTKMAQGRAGGRGGWWTASADELSAMLRSHADKGDPIDVAIISMMLSYHGAQISPASEMEPPVAVEGKMMKLATDTTLGSQIEIQTDRHSVRVNGLPNEQAKKCKAYLYEHVQLVIRPAPAHDAGDTVRGESQSGLSGDAVNWLTAGHAAHQTGVDLDVVRGWASRNEVESRNENGTLMVECASVLARAHRHARELREAASKVTRQDHVAEPRHTRSAGFFQAAGRLFAGIKA
ncbi:hypothetical protein GIY62_35355 (plasmid) [Burkholderia plantarii]|uniref:hypothetical protein n=1 Tax=Burkholderia plantarii TaxID=41899 RepID=UPI00272D2C7A|nr:hypothetical protein [Burkholderia plantarii]WLE64140.1 hypothetical protein GIY62_35355 [Burkholderia plantarii]